MRYLKVKFPDTGKVAHVEGVREDGFRYGDMLVVLSEKGQELVKVLGYSKEEAPSAVRFVRRAGREDIRKAEENEAKAQEAYKFCRSKIKEYGLAMKLLKAYIPLDGSRVFFYYTAEQRVDFRQLVRDLARVYRKRIEMRQVGVRDALQMMGWVGNCGEEVCCKRFTENFESVYLRDIEEQNLPLSPNKFTGPCGRLMCCLAYERDNYAVRQILPEVGTTICLQNREYQILHIDPLHDRIQLLGDEKKEDFRISQLLPFGYEKALKHCKECGCCRRNAKENETFAGVQE